MKKIVLMVIAVMFFASSLFAAVSSPCNARRPAKPAAPAQPREVVEEAYRRDPQGFRVPVQSVITTGTVHTAKATGDRDNQVTGGD